ncbi:MBL fold metallo-hydrolase, partial [Lysobacter sp. 2RAB21]
VLSTPQIKTDKTSVTLSLPFGDPLWNELYGGTTDADGLAERLRPYMQEPEREVPLLKSMLDVPQPAALDAEWTQETPRIRYFGHACVMIQCAG